MAEHSGAGVGLGGRFPGSCTSAPGGKGGLAFPCFGAFPPLFLHGFVKINC